MTIEELEQLKADGMIDDRKYQQLKSAISMQGYQPGQQVAPSNAYEMTNYGKNLQAQAEPMEQNFNPSFGYDAQAEKIAQLEQQIAQVKERIARNKRALSGKSYEDVNNQIAALEMKKINSQDPSMIWRWQQQRQDTKNANANVKSNEAAKFANTVDMWVNTRPAPTTEGIMQQISNINSAIRDGKNAGADVSKLVAKKEELENLVYGGDNAGTESEQKAGELETALTTAKTSAELIKLRNEYKWKPDQLTKLDTKIAELQKKEKANADEKDFQSWVEKQTGKKYNTLTKRMQDTYRRIYKNRGK